MIHGCAPSWRPHVQAVRNYVPEEGLKRHLNARSGAYGALPDVSDSDALTIDDSTIGASRACVIAREVGHEVTLFVNPAQIARGRFYWFSSLDALLDAREAATVTFGGREWDLSPGQGLRAFRLAAKALLMALAEDETDCFLDELAVLLQAGAAIVPEHARTMTLETLHELIELGVHIGSHGWDHRDIAAISAEELADDLRRAQTWFRSCLGINPAYYAVPYGVAHFPGCSAHEMMEMILLADPGLDVGFVGDRHWNRRDITRDLQGRLA